MMTRTLLIFIGITILVVLLFPKGREKAKQAGKSAVGICAVALGQTAQKQENKNNILVLLEERGELSNSEIRDEIGVSSRTVTRYMNELEQEEMAEQVGEIGRGVIYRLK